MIGTGIHREDAAAARALLLACHPAPGAAVTAVAAALAVAAGNGARSALLVPAAVAAGQLSIGWSNDALDAARDTASARGDKPVAVGTVTRRAVARAAIAAAALCVPLSLALGWRAGTVHLACVASAWTYNLGLKATPLSWLPYAVSFGLLPAVATLPLAGHPWPPAWALGAGAALGVGAHLVNALPDLDDDLATGVRGLPHRLGSSACGVLAPAVLVAASLLVLAAAPPRRAVAVPVTGTVVVLAVVAGVAALRARRTEAIAATAAIALVDVALLVGAGTALTT